MVIAPASVLAQTGQIQVGGTVTENNKKLPGAVIQLYANGSLQRTITSDNGKYSLTLDLGVDYVITFSKPGYITKRINFSTQNVPTDRAKNPFSDFPIDVSIFPEVTGVDLDDVLKQPIAKIVYDPSYQKVGDFNYDDAYTKSIQSLIDKLLKAQHDAEDKAKEVDAQYRKAIAKADGEFHGKDYDNAKQDYLAAEQIKPSEQYPKDQVAAIDKLKQQATSDAAAAIAQKKSDSLAAIKKAVAQKRAADSIANAKKAADAALAAQKKKQLTH